MLLFGGETPQQASSSTAAAHKARDSTFASFLGVSVTQVDVKGSTRSRDIKGTTALSWGVFPNREVQQPTIFDPETYMVSLSPLWLGAWLVVMMMLVAAVVVVCPCRSRPTRRSQPMFAAGVFSFRLHPTLLPSSPPPVSGQGVERGGVSTVGGPVGIPLRR